MAFNFNWSPLIADTSRARDMLTAALNKSPKPPIIVDDIIVTELNLGKVPPELEILEIGDLAEDRFRGIFKMQYSGDAFMTLKTRVQANPLNTYLSTKPSFASPRPLAAASGLTIPLQITLSDIRLSGFVILVFSKQKGITLVFRNDPLDSLKVSSTFDAIPFVRNYLQKEIEQQLRVLFMEDLPAIIHRLSLRLWVLDHPDSEAKLNSNRVEATDDNEPVIDPLATPSQRPREGTSRPTDDPDISSITLDDDTTDADPSFSQKNLLRLAALTDSHRTLSLFTPPIRDAVFRAWACAAERGDIQAGPTAYFTLASLPKHHATTSSASSVHSFSESGAAHSVTSGHAPTRPTLGSITSSHSITSTGLGRRSTNRKRKHRVVNLRKHNPDDSQPLNTRSSTPTSTAPSSHDVSEDRDGELVTPPDSPEKSTQLPAKPQHLQPDSTPTLHSPQPRAAVRHASRALLENLHAATGDAEMEGSSSTLRPSLAQRRPQLPDFKLPTMDKALPTPVFSPGPLSSGGILEQAWMMKMAAEIERKVRSEQAAAGEKDPGRFWGDEGPPAYAA